MLKWYLDDFAILKYEIDKVALKNHFENGKD